MKINKYLEFVQADFEAIKSFYLKDELNPDVWTGFEIDNDIRESLLKIALDFYNATDIKAQVVDVVLCGSLCNYNWSENYSDYDLHIIIDFTEISEDEELANTLCGLAKKVWNTTHDIRISGYEVEVGIQDKINLKESMEKGKMGGVYSLMEDKWVKKPVKADFVPDEDLIRSKAETVMDSIDVLEEESAEDSWEEFNVKVGKVWDKVKDLRKSGLDSEGGEFSIGNLIFKLLRRNGYTGKIIELKRKMYDEQYESLRGNEILKVLYTLDKLDSKMKRMSQEGYFMNLKYTINEESNNLRIEFDESDEDEKGNEVFDIDYSTMNGRWSEIRTQEGRETKRNKDYNFKSVDEVIKAIKSRFDVDI